jgi:hypothetical protein
MFVVFSSLRVKSMSHVLFKLEGLHQVLSKCVLYGCETWSLAVRIKHRLGVFDNSVMIRIFGPKSEELHNLYTSPNIVRAIKLRRMGWAMRVSRMEK